MTGTLLRRAIWDFVSYLIKHQVNLDIRLRTHRLIDGDSAVGVKPVKKTGLFSNLRHDHVPLASHNATRFTIHQQPVPLPLDLIQ
jgi:hypothetical protein